jgi:hypothetical protein
MPSEVGGWSSIVLQKNQKNRKEIRKHKKPKWGHPATSRGHDPLGYRKIEKTKKNKILVQNQ